MTATKKVTCRFGCWFFRRLRSIQLESLSQTDIGDPSKQEQATIVAALRCPGC